MAFGLNVNNTALPHREITEKQIKVACLCWFTSTGKAMPLRIKLEDETGEIQTMAVQVESSEEKNYCGIPFIEYRCYTFINHKIIYMKLVYFKHVNSWSMTVIH